MSLLDKIADYIQIAKAKDKTKPIEELMVKLDGLIKTIEDTSVLSKQNAEELLDSIKQIEISVPTPEVTVQAPKVNVSPSSSGSASQSPSASLSPSISPSSSASPSISSIIGISTLTLLGIGS